MLQETIRSETERAGVPNATAYALLSIEGMTCAACAMRIEKGVGKLGGVIESQVNLATERATVQYQAHVIPLERILAKIEALGYQAHPCVTHARTTADGEGRETPQEAWSAQAPTRRQAKEAQLRRKRVLVLASGALTLPVLFLSMVIPRAFSGESPGVTAVDHADLGARGRGLSSESAHPGSAWRCYYGHLDLAGIDPGVWDQSCCHLFPTSGWCHDLL